MEKVFKNPQTTEEFHDYLRTAEAKFQREFPHLIDRALIPYTIGEQIAHNGLRSRHDYPMQADRPEHDLGGLVRWVDRCGTKGDILMTPAIRGVRVELVYQGGMLHKAVNMGDGLEGKDITLNMYSVNGVPQQIPENERVNIHGVVTIDSIAVMALHRDPEVEVGMVVATALMNSFNDKRDPDGISALQFIPYMVNIPGVAYNLSDLRSILLAWDFMGLEAWHMKGTTRELGEFDEVTTAYKEKVLNRLIYPTEGITLQVNDTHDRLTLGHTSRWPEWSLKYIMGKPYVNAECKG